MNAFLEELPSYPVKNVFLFSPRMERVAGWGDV